MTWRTRNPAGVCVDGQDSAVHFRILSTELFLRPVVLFTLYVPTQRVTRKLLGFNRFQWGRTLHSDLLLRCRTVPAPHRNVYWAVHADGEFSRV